MTSFKFISAELAWLKWLQGGVSKMALSALTSFHKDFDLLLGQSPWSTLGLRVPLKDTMKIVHGEPHAD